MGMKKCHHSVKPWFDAAHTLTPYSSTPTPVRLFPASSPATLASVSTGLCHFLVVGPTALVSGGGVFEIIKLVPLARHEVHDAGVNARGVFGAERHDWPGFLGGKFILVTFSDCDLVIPTADVEADEK
jgi:hypothetical protein